MPGPQFNQAMPPRNWFSRHSQQLVLAAIVILIGLGGFFFYRSYQQRTDLLRPVLDNIKLTTGLPAALAPQDSPAPAVFQKADTVSPAAVSSAKPVNRESDNITVAATKGQGATHLARQALKTLLKEKPELASALNAEQRIYIEDYLRKHVTGLPDTLQVGDQITFSDALLNDAIDRAQQLSPDEIKNLGQYVPLVPSLMTS